jgi:RNA polymerase sigma factor (sigma-70 family)
VFLRKSQKNVISLRVLGYEQKAPAMNCESDLLPTRWSLLSRLKNWDDQASWQDFFNTYWQLIYGVAMKAGLNDAEAQDVVQETVITVAKNLDQFKTDPAHGSFKGWLLNTTRWRIADQFRRRSPERGQGGRPTDATTRTDTVARIPDPSGFRLEAVWDEEWEKNLLTVATENVKRQVSPEEYQIFDLCAVRNSPVKEVAAKLGVKVWKVYFAQKKVGGLLEKEVRKLGQKLG